MPFEIRGIQGLGYLDFWQGTDLLADVPENETKKLISDHIDVRFIPDEKTGAIKPDLKTLPAELTIFTPPLTKEELEKLYIELELGEKKYTAQLDFDKVGLKQEGKTQVHAYCWNNPEGEETRFLVGNKNPTIPQELKLTIGFRE